MDKPLYESLLYEIINARVCRRLPMIVSTNYNTTDLQKHYPDKICSRLLSFRLMAFFGNDIRRVLKKKQSSEKAVSRRSSDAACTMYPKL